MNYRAEDIDLDNDTIMGFPIRHLIAIAQMLRENEVTPEHLKTFEAGFIFGVDIANKEMLRQMKLCVDGLDKQ